VSTSGPRSKHSFWGPGAVEWPSLRIASASPRNDLTTNNKSRRATKHRDASNKHSQTVLVFDRLGEPTQAARHCVGSHHNDSRSYRHGYAILSRTNESGQSRSPAKREAEKAEWHRRIELRYEIRKLALDAVKAGIRARGDKLSLYSHAQLMTQANAMIGPWLVEQAKRQIAERNSQDMSKEERPAIQKLLLNETHAQNGATT
jgi:hypothetical protein